MSPDNLLAQQKHVSIWGGSNHSAFSPHSVPFNSSFISAALCLSVRAYTPLRATEHEKERKGEWGNKGEPRKRNSSRYSRGRLACHMPLLTALHPPPTILHLHQHQGTQLPLEASSENASTWERGNTGAGGPGDTRASYYRIPAVVVLGNGEKKSRSIPLVARNSDDNYRSAYGMFLKEPRVCCITTRANEEHQPQ